MNHPIDGSAGVDGDRGAEVILAVGDEMEVDSSDESSEGSDDEDAQAQEVTEQDVKVKEEAAEDDQLDLHAGEKPPSGDPGTLRTLHPRSGNDTGGHTYRTDRGVQCA